VSCVHCAQQIGLSVAHSAFVNHDAHTLLRIKIHGFFHTRSLPHMTLSLSLPSHSHFKPISSERHHWRTRGVTSCFSQPGLVYQEHTLLVARESMALSA